MTDDGGLLRSLRTRLDAQVPRWRPGARVADVRPLTGGASSLTYVVTLAEVPEAMERVVLKVAPPGLEPVRNRDVLRQAHLMHVLEGRPGVRTPASLFEDAGGPPDVPPYFAMNLVAGECVEPVLTRSEDRPAAEIVRSRCLDAAAALAALHAVDPTAVGIDEPPVTLDQEIERWARAFTTVPESLQGDYRHCADALLSSTPAPMRPVINHGDYRLGNTLCVDGRVTSIIDWEIWSVGDPRVDVTWLTFFTDEAAHPAAEPGLAHTPSKAELISSYEDAAGHRLDDMAWFDALTKFKEAGATSLLIKRGWASGDLHPMLERMVPAVPRLLAEAYRAVG